jgi:hypothetical protein
MRLNVGERLPGSGPTRQPGGYVVTGVVRETPWSGLYVGKKIFYNFDFTEKRPREAEDKEWLDVCLRTVQYAHLDDPAYVTGRRALARAEVTRVLGRGGSNLWPEPIDLLEVHNTRDPFTLPEQAAKLDPLEPVCILARPQGAPLETWRRAGPPRPAVLAVLAELLGFLGAAHDGGLVVNGLGPDTVLVDPAGRAHYVGTDLVVEARSAPGFDWGRFFPPERYAPGFAAPECFDPAAPRDRRTDLYAWAVLAHFLLTGADPAERARQQAQPWVSFHAADIAQLDKALRGLSQAQVRAWAEQLGVDGNALVAGWPGNLLAVFRKCVAAEPRLRPASAGDVRAWLLAPPPAPPAAALALRLPGEQVRLFFDLTGIDPAAQVAVRRAVGSAPLSAEEGEAVAEGPPQPWLDDTVARRATGHGTESIFYGIFTRLRRGGAVASSPGTPAQVFEPMPTNLRLYAEAVAPAGEGGAPEPAGVALLFQALDGVKVADALLGSALPAVRGWAVRRLGALWQASPPAAAAEPLLWNTLADPTQFVRLQAAAGLILGAGREAPPAAARHVLRRVLQALGGGDPDTALQAARLLPQVGVSKDLVRQAMAELEAERAATCPVCGQAVAARDRPEHLKTAHGYVDVLGSLLPREAALERLWSRVFLAADTQAHDDILALLDAGAAPSGTAGRKAAPYAAALQAQLRARAEGLLQAQSRELPRLVRCLRHNARAHRHFPALLRDDDPRVREVGRDLLLPDLGGRLSGDQVTAADVRRELDRLCPDELIEEKIALCRQLPYLGVDAVAARQCLARLLAERPVACRECGERMPGAQLEAHLRRAHRVFQFREVRRSLQEALAFLLEAVYAASPDHEAWAALDAITAEEYQARADAVLASWLAQKLYGLPGEQRQQAAESAAEVVTAGGAGPRLVPLLTGGSREAASRPAALHLALMLTARLPAPVDAALVQAVKPLLGDKQVPAEAREAAVAALLRTTGTEGPAVRELLLAFAAGTGKESAIRRLTHLEQRVGQLPAIDALCRELEDQIRMRCTRCATELPRALMIKHLWDEHRLVLEGRRVREPWRLIEDWLEDYRVERDPAVLERCRELTSRLDPRDGAAHLQRLLLQHGIDDPEARDNLLAQAEAQKASLCPHCYGFVPPAEALPPAEVQGEEGELAAAGFAVYASDRWLIPWLTVETPDGVLRDGLQPEWKKTRAGLVVFAAVPLLLLMIALMIFVHLPLLLLLGVMAGAAVVFGGILYLCWPKPPPLRDRAVDAAWEILVPRLLDDLTRPASAFLAGLAHASAGRGSAARRADALLDACEAVEEKAKADPARARHLGAVRRLLIEDGAKEGEDPITLLLEQAERSLSGKVPLGFADELLVRPVRGKAAGRARLRALLCARAFERGLEFPDLTDLGKAYPALGAALGAENAGGLAQLRLLWWLRNARPWQKLGDARTVFELAEDRKAGGKRLEQCPELLLAVEASPPTYLGTQGVLFEGTWITALPPNVEVAPRHSGPGWDLVVGPHRFRFRESPDDVAKRLERWLRYYFGDFRPQAESVRRWRQPAALAPLSARNGVKCPECKRRVLPRLGEVGVLLEEPEPARQPVAG